VRQGELNFVEMDKGKFFSSVKIKNSGDNFCWEVINVYGPVKHELKSQFCQELYEKIKKIDIPFFGGM
jgi:hypothetical protein